MDKSEGKDWFAKTLNNVTEETAKVYKISRLKLEANSLNKLYAEKLNKMSRRLIKLIANGDIDAALFEPEYSGVIQIKEKMETIEQEIEDIKNNLKIGFNKNKTDDDIINVKAESVNEENEGKKEK